MMPSAFSVASISTAARHVAESEVGVYASNYPGETERLVEICPYFEQYLHAYRQSLACSL